MSHPRPPFPALLPSLLTLVCVGVVGYRLYELEKKVLELETKVDKTGFVPIHHPRSHRPSPIEEVEEEEEEEEEEAPPESDSIETTNG